MFENRIIQYSIHNRTKKTYQMLKVMLKVEIVLIQEKSELILNLRAVTN